MSIHNNPRRAAFIAWMKVHDLRVADVQRRSGIPYTTIASFVKREGAKMLAETEQRIAEAYGITTDDIFTGRHLDAGASVFTARKRDTSVSRSRNKDFINDTKTTDKYQSPNIRSARTIPILGYVEAGAWREMNEYDQVIGELPFVHPLYDPKDCFGYIVKGDSVNKAFPDGTTVICVSPDKKQLRIGHFVIIKDTSRPGLAELTIKRAAVDDRGRPIFEPCSTNPRWQQPLIPPLRDEAAQVGWEVIGIVFTKYEPVESDGEFISLAFTDEG